MDFEKLARDLVSQKMAAEALQTLTPDQQAALLQSGLKHALGGYTFNRLVEEGMSEAIRRIVSDIVNGGLWDKIIIAHVEQAFADFIRFLRPALVVVLTEAISGGDGTDRYHRSRVAQVMARLREEESKCSKS